MQEDEFSSAISESIGEARSGDGWMDYSTFLTDTTKDELDRLDKLEGDFKVLASKLTMVRDCHHMTGVFQGVL